ncbi:Contact-dependent inhibitor A, partial [Salmonella enterica subsp. enterica]|nr:Contact-dependent inhibitor A [Salmonella enterica subsp. enterica serovar Abaetetuba]
LQGLAGGNLAGALAGASAPELAHLLKSTEGNPAVNAIAHAILGGAVAALQGNSAAAGAVGAGGGELAARAIANMLYPGVDKLSEEQKQTVSVLASISAGLAGGIATGNSAGAATAAGAGKNAVENNLLGKALVEGCAIAAPCRTKVAEQLLEIGVKAGITGIVAKEIADKISAEELDHLITLKMTGNDDITSKYLGLLEGKYGPSNTGGDQIADSGPTNTGGNQTATGNVPTHTGNNQASGQGTTNTGNTEGVPDTGGNTTITPIPEQNKDDLAYLALKGKEAQEAAKNLGFDRRIPPQKAPFDSHGQPVFYNGKNYITPDVDSHNVSNGWKLFNSKGKRIGTYDSELNKIKD